MAKASHFKARAVLLPGLVAGLAWFYYVAAMEHGRVVNTFKARGDQTAYLVEAKLLYANWYGLNDPPLPVPRNRMPVYAAYQALFYGPWLSDPEFFEVAKVQNIWLSIVLLVLLAGLVWGYLPPIVAANFLVIVAFGYFVFKAGYVQSELLFYFFAFAAFLALCELIRRRDRRLHVPMAVTAGLLAALAHLTKAAILPLVAVFMLIYVLREITAFLRTRDSAVLIRRGATAGAFLVAFLAVIFPYISTSKRLHSQYFYNLNTSVLVWYDNWPRASIAIRSYGPDGWPRGPRSMRLGPLKYWREHTVKQIVGRVAGGFRDMAVRSYRTFWYLKFVLLYIVFALILVCTRWPIFVAMVREHVALFAFMMLYAATYLIGIAFYEPISGTGTTRFLLAHVAPLLFVLSCFFARRPFSDTSWTVAGVSVTPTHFHLLVSVTLAFDLAFNMWPRLMTTYGGF